MSASEGFAALAWDLVHESAEDGPGVEVEEVEEEAEDSLEEVVEEELEVDAEDWLEVDVEAAEAEGAEDWPGEEVDTHIGERVGEEAEEGVEAEVEAEVEAVTEAWGLHLGNHLCWCCCGNYRGNWLNLLFLCHPVRSSQFASCPKPSQQPPPQPEEPPLLYHRLPQLSQTILEVLERLPTKCLLLRVYTQLRLKNCFDAFAVKGGRENLSLRNEGV